MTTKITTKVLPLLAVFIVIGILQSSNQLPTFAQDQCQTFKETGKSVCGRFLEYWKQNGDVAQQGYPISNEFQEVSDLNGQAYTVQYFERAVFEKHPENQPPYDVLLSQLGKSQFKTKYPKKEPTRSTQGTTPAEVVSHFFGAMALDGGTAIRVQQALLTKRLLARAHGYTYHRLLGENFPTWKTTQYAPGTDLSGVRPAWVLFLDEAGTTVAVFTLIMEDGAWKIDDVEPNILNP
jgi:hypothetical protein